VQSDASGLFARRLCASTATPIVRLRHAIGTQLATEAAAPVAAAVDVDTATWTSRTAPETLPTAVADHLEQAERSVRSEKRESLALVRPGCEPPGARTALEPRRRAELLHYRVQRLHRLGLRGGIEGSRQPCAQLTRTGDVVARDRVRGPREA